MTPAFCYRGNPGCSGSKCTNCFERRVIFSLSENAKLTPEGQKSQQFTQLKWYIPDYLEKCRESGPDGNGKRPIHPPCKTCSAWYCTCNAHLNPVHYRVWDKMVKNFGAEDEEKKNELLQRFVNVNDSATAESVLNLMISKLTFDNSQFNNYLDEIARQARKRIEKEAEQEASSSSSGY